MRLIADEELFLEGAELAARQVAVDAAGGLAHLAVGELHTGRHQMRDALGLVDHPRLAAAVGDLRRLAEILRFRLVVPAETARMADEAADGQVLETARTIPRALVVGVEDVALGIEADAARRSDTAGRRHELAVLRHLAGPAAELAVAVE